MTNCNLSKWCEQREHDKTNARLKCSQFWMYCSYVTVPISWNISFVRGMWQAHAKPRAEKKNLRPHLSQTTLRDFEKQPFWPHLKSHHSCPRSPTYFTKIHFNIIFPPMSQS